MQWKVGGADASTGEDCFVVVEAITQQDAVSLARDKGILASEIECLDEPKVERKSAPVRIRRVPDYTGLKVAGGMLRGTAVVTYLVAAIFVVMAIGAAIRHADNAGELLLYGLGAMCVGVLYHALGSACYALRDMARNSFANPSC